MNKTRYKTVMRYLVGITTALFLIKPAFAQPSMTEILLTQIRDTSYTILDTINKTPTYIEVITEMAESWINTEDKSQMMANSQFMFAKLETNKADTIQSQMTMSQEFTNNFLLLGSRNTADRKLPGNPNSLNYSIMLGQPLPNTEAPKDAEATNVIVKKFIQNLGGLEVQLQQPDPNWRTSSAAENYKSFYNTIASIKSYNAFILSGLYNQKESDEINTNLRNQSTSSEWFEQIATEPLGVVLRQILMYNSQIYVQLNHLLKLQQQMAAEQAITNTLVALAAQHLMGENLLMKATQAK